MKHLFLALSVMLAGCAGVSRHPAPASGAWAIQEDGSHLTDLVVFDNDQCVRIDSQKNPFHAGSFGFSAKNGNQLLCVFGDGSSGTLVSRGERVIWQTGSDSISPAVRVDPAIANFIGLWRLNPEPDGRFLIVQLHSDGTARDSLGESQGHWELRSGEVLCTWPSGWRDMIVKSGGAYLKKSWAPGSSLADDPADTSVAMRLGAGGFTFSP